MSQTRWYRITLIVSLTLNVLLGSAFWLYIHFAGFLSTIEDVVGFID